MVLLGITSNDGVKRGDLTMLSLAMRISISLELVVLAIIKEVSRQPVGSTKKLMPSIKITVVGRRIYFIIFHFLVTQTRERIGGLGDFSEMISLLYSEGTEAVMISQSRKMVDEVSSFGL